MKVLTITRTPFDRESSIGNTLSNMFQGLPDVEFYNISCQSGSVNFDVVKRAYQMNDMAVLQSVRSGRVGEVIDTQDSRKSDDNILKSSTANHSVRKNFFTYLARDLIWKLGRWNNRNLRKFIDEINPDIIYAPLYHSLYMCDVTSAIIAYSKKPFVGFICDDVYSMPSITRHPFKSLYRALLRSKIKPLISLCSYCEVYAPAMIQEYGLNFNKKFYLTSKGINLKDICEIKPHKADEPYHFVYTGGIGGGRFKQLETLAFIIDKHFNVGSDINAYLDIYTQTHITNEMKQWFDISKCAQYHGKAPNDKIKEIQQSADYLIHVEGFGELSIFETRLSFSTKLIDYMACMRPIIAIGPMTVNSMQILSQNKLAWTAGSIDEVDLIVEKICTQNNWNEDVAMLQRVRDYLTDNCDILKLQHRFLSRIKSLIH